MKNKQGFTLAEVLITLAIIGVVAALTIPSVVANTQQQEFKTGLKKAVSVLNSAITMNMAIDGESPRENTDLYNYLKRHMNLMVTSSADIQSKWIGYMPSRGSDSIQVTNKFFYTTDGMRFEFPYYDGGGGYEVYLYEDDDTFTVNYFSNSSDSIDTGGCGHFGMKADEFWNDPSVDKQPPCIMIVDVNGDRKPYPQNASCKAIKCAETNMQKYADPNGKRLTDLFMILVTDEKAIPYGTAAQKAMYESQK